MRILFVGDIFGKPGLRTLSALLPGVIREQKIDLVVANGENSASGYGVTPSTASQMYKAGVDVITTGNHLWDRRELLDAIGGMENLTRPANKSPGQPGKGWCVVERAGRRVAVINLVGRVFMEPADCPFRAAEAALEEVSAHRPDFVVVDFHAEATSEKQAMGHFLDGRVAAVVGTHTHVATADARVLPGNTGYITDLGMTGVAHSIIGLDRDRVTKKFFTGLPVSTFQAEGRGVLNGAILEAEKDKRSLFWRFDAVEP